MNSRNARIAGLLYLTELAAVVRLEYIPSVLSVDGNDAATLTNIATHETLFRWGMVADLFTGVMVIFVALALYRLLSFVNKNLAKVMVILGGIMPSLLYFVNVLNDAAVLGALAQHQNPLATFFLNLHFQGVLVSQVFWGLWLLPFGWLVFCSRILPRWLGIWLLINGLTYVALSAVGLLLPGDYDTVSNYAFPGLAAELVAMLWLVIMGAKDYPVPSVAAELVQEG